MIYTIDTFVIYIALKKGIDGIEYQTMFRDNYIFKCLGGKEFSIKNESKITK